MALRAAIFDVGGVLTTSPVSSIRAYAARLGLDYDRLGPLLASHEGAWSRFEKNELPQAEFCQLFEAECTNVGLTLRGEEFLGAFFGALTVRQEMVGMVEALRGRLRLGCITNNVAREDSRPRALLALDGLFDVVLESSKVGLRKPDPRIYQLACEQLEVEPAEAVFLDDFGVNLKAARALGMTTIKVDETLSALREMEALLGLSFRPGASLAPPPQGLA